MKSITKKLLSIFLVVTVIFSTEGMSVLATETDQQSDVAEESLQTDETSSVDEVSESETEEPALTTKEDAAGASAVKSGSAKGQDAETVAEKKEDEEADATDLVNQTLTANVQSGNAGIVTMSATGKITLSGVMSKGASVKATPVDVEIAGISVLAAYDITIYDADGNEYQPQDGSIRVHIENSAIRSAEAEDANLVVYHMKSKSATPEKISVKEAADGAVEFNAESFSIYVVGSDDTSMTDADGEAHYYYTVTFYVQDDTGAYQIYSGPQRVSPGEAVAEPGVPEVEGHSFIGWYTEETGGTQFTFDTGGIMPEITNGENHTLNLYARYAENYYVYYHTRPLSEATEEHPSSVFHIDTYHDEYNSLDTTEATELYEQEGYLDGTEALIGWVDADGNTIEDGTEVTGDMMLYPDIADALWIYFDTNGKDATVAPLFEFGDVETISDLPTDVTCAGYTFAGWYMNAECTGDKVTSETPIKEITSRNDDGSIILYAKWEEANVHYTVNIWRQKATDGKEGLDQKEFAVGEEFGTYSAYYDFAESIEVSAEDSTLKSDESISTDILSAYSGFGSIDPSSSDAYNGFEYNQNRTENELSGKTVASDGSTVINVYYDRVTITWYFWDNGSRQTDTSRSDYEGSLIGLYGTNLTPTNGSEPGGTLDDIPGHHRSYTFRSTDGNERVTSIETKFILRDASDPTTVYYWLRANGIYTAYISYYKEVDEDAVPSGATTRTAFGKTYMLADEIEYSYTTASATHYYYLYNEYDGYEVAGYNLGKYKFSNNNLDLGDDKSAVVGDSAHLQSTYTTHRGSSVLYIYYDRIDYTVTLESNAKIISLGTNDTPYYNASATYTKQYPYDAALDFTLPTPANLDGTTFGPTTNGAYYEFTGNWFADPTLEVPFDWSQYETMPAYNLVAFAEWQLKDVTVTFDSDGGSEVEDQTIKATERATEPDEPTKDGYTFVGWQDTSTGKFFNFSTVLYEDIELKAVWQSADAESHPLIYDLNLNGIGQDIWQGDDEYATDSEVGVVGLSTAFPDLDEAQAERFICWNTAADGTGTNYYPDETYKITGITDTLYARWATEHTSTLTLDHNYPAGYTHGDEIHDVDEVTQDNLTDVDLEKTTGLEHGYTITVGTTTYRFEGWSTKQTYATSATDGDVEISGDAIVAADTINENAVNTLYAVWVALDPVTVTKVVDPNGVSGFDPTGDTFTFTYTVDDSDDEYDISDGSATVSELEEQDDGTWTGTFLIPEVSTGATVTVTETFADEKYTTTISSNSEATENTGASITITMPSIAATITVTNTLNVDYLTVEKIWNDGESADRPDAVAFTLSDGSEEIAEIEMTADDEDVDDENLWSVDLPVIVSEDADYSLSEADVGGYTSSIATKTDDSGEEIGFTVTNTKLIDTQNPGTLTVSKTWLDGDADHSNDSITVQLYANGDAVDDATVTLSDANEWSADFTDLPAYDTEGTEITYTVAETSVPDGYTESYSNLENGEITITNTKLIDSPEDKDPGTLTVSKKWIDGNADHSSDNITVQLYANDETVEDATVILDAAGDWSADFTDLVAYDEDGEIEYSVEETEVPNGYTASYSDLEDGAITITNTVLYDGGATPGVITVSKEWNDGNADHSSDSITVKLYANTALVDGETVTLNVSDEWSADFTDLPAYDADGEEIAYIVREDEVPDGYTDSYSDLENGEITITNTALYDGGTGTTPGEITVSKEWNDNDDQDGKRPESVTVQLLADNEEVADAIISEYNSEIKRISVYDGKWVATFTDLPAYDTNGEKITYTVKEIDVPDGYAASYSDLENGEITITNTKLIDGPEGKDPGTLTVNKTWIDGDADHSGDSITVQLYANEDAVDDATVTLDAADGWSADFTGLPAYDADGEIEYTVEETEVPDGYTDSYSDLKDGEITITNTKLINGPDGKDAGTLTVNKKWVDGDADHANDSITAQLYANGDAVDDATVTLDAAGGWSADFTGLPAYDADGEIEYTVEEAEVPAGYTDSYSDLEDGEITITNTKLIDGPEGKDAGTLTVNKTWLDGDTDHSSDSITVQLYANDDAVDDATVTLDAAGGWSADFSGLPAYDADGEIEYTVEEAEVPAGYTDSYSDLEDGEITITNTKLIDGPDGKDAGTLTVNKTWLDGGVDHSSDSITVKLYANKTLIDDEMVTLDASTEWSADFTSLAAYDEDGEIEYTVEETEVPDGYTDSYSDLENGEITITNTALYDGGTGTTPGEITVSIDWDDNDNQDGKRPDSVTVQLFADNEEEVADATISENNSEIKRLSVYDGKWIATFTDMPGYNESGEITYTATEDPVPDEYEVIYDENDATATAAKVESGVATITNEYEPDMTDLTVTVVWKDSSNNSAERPASVTVTILADGTEIEDGTLTLTADDGQDGNWVKTLSGLPVYASGSKITYTVDESAIDHYVIKVGDVETDEDGNSTVTITNYYVNEYEDIDITKIWDDEEDKDGKRPDSIHVTLSDNEVFDYDADITESDDWSYTFESVPKDLDGEELTYSLTEDEVSGYTSSIEGSEKSFTVTNTFTSETKKNPDDGGNGGNGGNGGRNGNGGNGGNGGGTSGSGTTGAKTADTNNIGLWLALLIAGLVAAVSGFAMKRRQR